MRKIILIGLLTLIILVSGCVEEQRACTLEAKVCPDGSTVGRVGPNCEFDSCPESEEKECTTDTDCGTGGCSGQICGQKDEVKDIITTCEWREEYDCYRKTACSCVDSKCQWEETDEFLNCMEASKSPAGVIT